RSGTVPGERLRQVRAVFDGARHRAGVVERPGEREHVGPAAATVGRLQPYDAAERRRSADRAPRIAAAPAGGTPSGQRGAVWVWSPPRCPRTPPGPGFGPPVPEPVAPWTSPAASAAPEPLLEPPGMCSRFHGLRAGGERGRGNCRPKAD